MKTRVKVVFPANLPDRPSWPYVGYDVEKRSREVLSVLERQLSEFEFSGGVYYSTEEAERAYQAEQGQYDGYLVYMTALWSGIAELYVRNARPVIVADELYSGSGGLLRVHSLIRKEHLPIVGVASSDFQDIIDAVRLFGVMKAMRQANILVIADGETWGARQEVLSHVLDTFGTRAEQMSSDALKTYYERTDAEEAEHWKDKWTREALKVVEPDGAEILRSARMYLALRAAMRDAEADAVTVDCLGLYYGGKLFAYPCLGFFQLNNEGSTGVCEADVDSTLTQLLIRYLTGRPGYVSDPVIDTATGQIIYAHCVATNRVFGPHGLANPYVIRSHAEDGKGASVQSLLPLGQPVTTLKVSTAHDAFAIHTGRTVGNVEDDKACRTKLAAEVDAQRILDNYRSELFGWHRVTCYGDYRKPFVDLATLYGLDIHKEDR
jgi:L-fucose isomerase-like protein